MSAMIRRWFVAILAMPLILVLIVSTYRCWAIEEWTRASLRVEGEGSIFFTALQSECLSIGVFVCIYALALSIRKRWLSVGLLLTAGLFAFWMTMDTFILVSLLKRLDFSDVLTFGSEPATALDFLRLQLDAGQRKVAIGLMVTALFSMPITVAVVMRFPSFRLGKTALYAALAVNTLLALPTILQYPAKSVMSPYLVSTIEFNFVHGHRSSYSPTYLTAVRQRQESGGTGAPACIDGLNLRRTVVIVVVESLSSYQS
jgi:hypothetical protein